MLNKPRGYVTTMSDERGRKTVSELVRDAGGRLYPVGRLDMDSEGLLLMTDDGELGNSLMHPSHEVPKTYLVRVRGQVTEEGLRRLREAITLDGKSVRAEKVVLKESGDESSLLSITIRQGLNRQIRRMCDASGLKVLRLKRVAEGSLKLGQLPPGQWRRLTEKEVQELRKL
jgi:23S rRNA pseudouridine2605 synthase